MIISITTTYSFSENQREIEADKQQRHQMSRKRNRDEAIGPTDEDDDDVDPSSSTSAQVESQPEIQSSNVGVDESNPVRRPPAYGSQHYWEERYRNQFEVVEVPAREETREGDGVINNNNRQQTSGVSNTIASAGDEQPDPFHAWYFNYEELAPILLPLVLGDDIGVASASSPKSEDGLKDDAEVTEQLPLQGPSTSTTSYGEATINIPIHQRQTGAKEVVSSEQGNNLGWKDDNQDNTEGIDDQDDWEEVEEGSDNDNNEEDEVPRRVGLARHGPISVLEIGCGDVPLGRDLADGLAKLPVHNACKTLEDQTDQVAIHAMDSKAEISPTMIIQKVICIDYSETVIRVMKEEQQRKQSKLDQDDQPQVLVQGRFDNNHGKTTNADATTMAASQCVKSIPIEYQVADARQLPYSDESFQLILEKGTLDAMISDTEKGSDNCRSIVKECSRILAIGGAMMIVSHLNAHVPSGMKWLNEILMAGLRQGSMSNGESSCQWQIEIHGGGDEPPAVGQGDCPNRGNGDGDNNDDNASRFSFSSEEDGNPGPAVYIVHKNPPELIQGGGGDKANIPLKFFTY